MTGSDLASIAEKLRQQETDLASRKEELQAEVVSVDGELRRVTAALAALDGKRGAKPEATTEDVKNAILRILGEEDVDVLDRKSLLKRVRAELSDKAARGLATRFDEAVSDEQLVSDTAAGFRLRAQSAVVEPEPVTGGWSGGE